jgi:hypothetical protein
MATVTGSCPISGENWTLEVDGAAYDRWRQGELIQKAFPYLLPDQRELLMTGIVSKAWDETFGEEED